MPRRKWPEARRMKAMRSRCFGSMLAWILKTKPLTSAPSGGTASVSVGWGRGGGAYWRSEEHTSELQSLMRISYAVFCLKTKKKAKHDHRTVSITRTPTNEYDR